MDIQDFEGTFRYKMYLPILYVASWIFMIIGPRIFPSSYHQYTTIALKYLAIRSTMTFIWTLIGAWRANRLLNQFEVSLKPTQQRANRASENGAETKLLNFQERAQAKYKRSASYYHAFIVPNFKEQEEILESTLQQLASHPVAKDRFLVLLAMEAHEEDSQIKAKKLIDEFKANFSVMHYTVHEMRPNEQKGKAANVSWCVEHLEQDLLTPLQIDSDKVMLTIIDADSWVPQLYIEEVDRLLELRFGERSNLIFQPCQMFTRNCLSVPALTRTYDMTHGLVHFSNLFSLFETSFPLSNYSLSYQLAKRIGFWDTCPDAIGEDFHTTIKAFWKTRGQVRTVCVFTPFNQVSIETGKGYFNDMSRRFWQAERHGRGCADAAYCLKRIFKEGLNGRLFMLVYQVIEITTLPAVLPWCMISSTVMSLWYWLGGSPNETVSGEDIQWLYNVCTLSFILSFFLYYWVCRRASRLYYGVTLNNGLLRTIEYVLWFIPNIFLVTVPSATIAAFRVAFGTNQYEVAEKTAGKGRLG